jgi:hypothetical protein
LQLALFSAILSDINAKQRAGRRSHRLQTERSFEDRGQQIVAA